MTLAATAMLEYRANYADSNLDKQEHRPSIYGAFEAFKNDSGLIPEQAILAARGTEARLTKVPVINRMDTTITTVRSCSVITKLNTSALVTVTWSTINTGFSMIPSQYANNDIAYQQDFNKKMKSMQRTINANIDTACVAKLNTNKSVVNNADGNPWPVVANTMEIPYADKDTLWNELDAVMAANDINEKLVVVGSPRLKAFVGYDKAQGPANDENFAFQFDNVDFLTSNRVTTPDASLYAASFYCFPEMEALAFMSWIDPEARRGAESTDGKEWSQEFLPDLGFDVGLMFQSACGDQSSEGGSGLEAAVKESFSFSFDYALVTPYNSDSATYPAVIYRGNILK